MLTDLTLCDRDGGIVAVVEVKNKRGTTALWAAQLRRNLLAHGGIPAAPFFLLVTPDRLYLWKDAGNEPAELLPQALNASEFFASALQKLATGGHEISGKGFELLVAGWLSELTRGAHQEIAGTSPEVHALVEALRDGHLAYPRAA